MYPSFIQFETRWLELERELRFRRELRARGAPGQARRWSRRRARAGAEPGRPAP